MKLTIPKANCPPQLFLLRPPMKSYPAARLPDAERDPFLFERNRWKETTVNGIIHSPSFSFERDPKSSNVGESAVRRRNFVSLRKNRFTMPLFNSND